MAAVLGALAGAAMISGESRDRGARQVAIQGISSDEIDGMTPAALSRDGRLIAFVSRNRETSRRYNRQVYLLDRSTGLITRESLGPDGTPSDGDSRAPSLSLDGQVIAFEMLDELAARGASPAAFDERCIPGDCVATHSNTGGILARRALSAARITRLGAARDLHHGLLDGKQTTRRLVIVRDRQNGVWRTPQSVAGEPLNGNSGAPVVSGNGLAVVFSSHATNLSAALDTNGELSDIYLWRLADATVTRVSVNSDGVQPAIGASHSPSVSRDGNFIAFASTARLTTEDTNSISDVYLRDVGRGVTSLASVGIGARSADGASHSPALSADGRYLAFVSDAANLAPRDRNQDSDVFIYEVATRSIALVSATAKGTAANAASSMPAISADGRYVVYQSVASNLGSALGCPRPVPDTNLLSDVYLFDRAIGCVTRISGSPAQDWWTPSVAPAIDAAGSVVVFPSTQPMDQHDLTTDFDLFLFGLAPLGNSATARTGRPHAAADSHPPGPRRLLHTAARDDNSDHETVSRPHRQRRVGHRRFVRHRRRHRHHAGRSRRPCRHRLSP